MSNKINKKRLLSDSIVLNAVAIGVVGVLLIILTLLFMNIYTRHGHNVIVPDLKGLQSDEAKALLTSKGLSVQVIDSIFKADAIPGSIIDQTPKPSNRVKEGRSIYITIYSYNPQQISIPDLVDYSSRQAISLLNSIGFTDIEVVERPAEYSGIVLSVEYKGRRLQSDDMVPLGHPLRLIVGTSNIGIDSLEIDEQFITNPSGEGLEPNSKTNSGSKASNMDDSFF